MTLEINPFHEVQWNDGDNTITFTHLVISKLAYFNLYPGKTTFLELLRQQVAPDSKAFVLTKSLGMVYPALSVLRCCWKRKEKKGRE